ncbi:uncharacterized protein A1O9_00299 [Exophiala aquamarina CBS 119918]|uniref:LysM domain-containing protein n=1 Tax=Exophiala aquamarina CBS 119918 TaxID=1182545 RepID=A0A072PRH0_9EURO|nr:uncharacterized protein A1O9_00299 [Exophiala aquamarina CBS 119918]KEF62327.1 hypothetical protein A1O9_00299 [Exophiala aquamarina CBS 119918]
MEGSYTSLSLKLDLDKTLDTGKITGTLLSQYAIQSGDTLSEIAEKVDGDLKAIIQVSPCVKPEGLCVGQITNIPTGQTGVAVFSLEDVAGVLGVPLSSPQSFNSGILNELSFNQVIVVPGPPEETLGSVGGTDGGG